MSIVDVGDVYQLSYDHYVGGVLASAGAATWTVTLPDGTTSSLAATAATTGKYRNDFSPTVGGRHVARWVGTGANAGTYVEAFDVRPATAVSLLSIADAKAHLNIASDTHDGELRMFLEASTLGVERAAGRVVARRSFTHTAWGLSGAAAVHMPRTPLLSLTTVATVDGASTWTVGNLDADPEGRVTVLSGPLFDGDVRFTYVAGQTAPGADYLMAARIVLQDLWATQRGGRGGPRFAGQPAELAEQITAPVWRQVQMLLGDPLPGFA